MKGQELVVITHNNYLATIPVACFLIRCLFLESPLLYIMLGVEGTWIREC